MDINDAKRWLYRGWNLNREIVALKKLKNETYAALTSGVATPDAAPGGGSDPHKLEHYAGLSDLIDRRVNELTEIKAEILQAIQQVDDSRYRTLLLDRYTRFMRWEQVAEEMHYSFRHVLKLHEEALTVFSEKIAWNSTYLP